MITNNPTPAKWLRRLAHTESRRVVRAIIAPPAQLLLRWSDEEAECVEAAAECNNDVAEERGQHDAVTSE